LLICCKELTSAPCRPEQRKLNILVGDFVKTDLPYFDVCISNTPYQVRPVLHDIDTRSSS